MKRLLIVLFPLFCVFPLAFATTVKIDSAQYVCDGGMMIHTGYLTGDIDALGYHASGAPYGIGGIARYHFAKHWRVGGEGYVSNLGQKGNGSFFRYAWGGALLDFYWEFRRVMPYIGFTVGGGSNTTLLIMDEPDGEWEPVGETYYRKKAFGIVDPYIGMDVIITKHFHLTFKLDCLIPMRKRHDIPIGPRFYLGFLFYH
ncbi:MAG: hypothetical protein MJ002_07405 [Paludibacteraceae bacterium]|nr:hypothetical protein [Paludibacteraceae bacterium]